MVKESILRYPGKVTVVEQSGEILLAVADSGNHRIILLTHDGRIVVSKFSLQNDYYELISLCVLKHIQIIKQYWY